MSMVATCTEGKCDARGGATDGLMVTEGWRKTQGWKGCSKGRSPG